MTEGGGAHLAGQIPVDFVRALPNLAHKYGSIWHLDEVVTGFRDHVGGFQALVGVTPDLTSFGKIVSGGTYRRKHRQDRNRSPGFNRCHESRGVALDF